MCIKGISWFLWACHWQKNIETTIAWVKETVRDLITKHWSMIYPSEIIDIKSITFNELSLAPLQNQHFYQQFIYHNIIHNITSKYPSHSFHPIFWSFHSSHTQSFHHSTTFTCNIPSYVLCIHLKKVTICIMSQLFPDASPSMIVHQ